MSPASGTDVVSTEPAQAPSEAVEAADVVVSTEGVVAPTEAMEPVAAEPAAVRVPRVIRPVVLIDEGPLVLVETRRDLAGLQLPFERSQEAVSA